MFTLPDLPFALNALEPHMSARTLEFHHARHHKAYVDKLNALIKGTEFQDLSLEDIIRRAARDRSGDGGPIFDNAGQHWNHSFFWQSLAPPTDRKPQGALGELLARDLGGPDGFARAFGEQGAAHFGSGWAWLVLAGGSLAIETTHDADTPLAHGKVALLCCDLWEHAYYLDYQNRRPDFLKSFTASLANWAFAERNLEAARVA